MSGGSWDCKIHLELEYSFFRSFSCFSSSIPLLSPSQNSQLFTSLEFCNQVNDDVLHCWTERGMEFPVWLWSLSVLVIAPAATGENETLQPQVLCYTSHLLDPVLYSLVSTTLQTKPGFFWHSFSCSSCRNSTIQGTVLYRDIKDSVVFQSSSLHQLYWFTHYSKSLVMNLMNCQTSKFPIGEK